MNAASEYPTAALTYATNTHSIHTHLIPLMIGFSPFEERKGEGKVDHLQRLFLLWKTLLEICLRFAVATLATTTTVALAAACAQSLFLFLFPYLSLSVSLSALCRLFNMLWNCITFSKSALVVCLASCLVPAACCRLEISAFPCVCVWSVCVWMYDTFLKHTDTHSLLWVL